MSTESVIDFDFSAKEVNLAVDSNKDGQHVVKMKLNISEAIAEAIQRGEPVEGAKLADFRFDGSKAYVAIDTDLDSEKLIEIEIDLMEVVDEVKDLVF